VLEGIKVTDDNTNDDNEMTPESVVPLIISSVPNPRHLTSALPSGFPIETVYAPKPGRPGHDHPSLAARRHVLHHRSSQPNRPRPSP
jgi:hypothetical protein